MKRPDLIAILAVTGAFEGIVMSRQWSGEGAGILITIPNFLAILFGVASGVLSAVRGADPINAPAAGAVFLIPTSLVLFLTLGATIDRYTLLILAGSLFPLSFAALFAYAGAHRDAEERKRRGPRPSASSYWEA